MVQSSKLMMAIILKSRLLGMISGFCWGDHVFPCIMYPSLWLFCMWSWHTPHSCAQQDDPCTPATSSSPVSTSQAFVLGPFSASLRPTQQICKDGYQAPPSPHPHHFSVLLKDIFLLLYCFGFVFFFSVKECSLLFSVSLATGPGVWELPFGSFSLTLCLRQEM